MQNRNLKKILPLLIIVLFVSIFFVISKNKKETTTNDFTNEPVQNIELKDEAQPGVTLETKQKEIGLLFDQAVKQQIKGDFAGSKLTLEKALAIDPKNAYIMQTYASLLNNTGDKKGAMLWIDKALAINPKEIHFWYLKFDLSKEAFKNDTNSIELIYKDAITKTGNSVDMVTAYASFLGSIGRKTDAIVQWQKAITLNPQNKSLYEKEISYLK